MPQTTTSFHPSFIVISNTEGLTTGKEPNILKLLSDHPEYGHPIQLVECIVCINTQKYPLFFFLMLLPKLLVGICGGYHL
jgi:hypothetical protein